MSDKRSVSTDALDTLGTIIHPGEKRDAIHLAVEPVQAAERLFANDDVGLLPDGTASTTAAKKLGKVDPFLETCVEPGQTFWLVVYPRQIKSLRHVWEHPDFPASIDLPAEDAVEVINLADIDITTEMRQMSEEWIRHYVVRLNHEHHDPEEQAGYYNSGPLTYDELMDAAMEHVSSDWSWLTKGPMLEGVSVEDEFWRHFSTVVSMEVPEDKRHSFFSCSC